VQATLADLSGRALGYVRAREIAGGEEVLAELAHLHPVEQLVGLENALARWVDDPSAGALYGELPELRAYCERRVAELEAAADAALWRGRRRWPALHEGGAADGDAAAGGGTAAGNEEIDPDGGDDLDDGAGNAPWELQHDFETLIAAIDAVAPGPADPP
jgi:hypothetical protein